MCVGMCGSCGDDADGGVWCADYVVGDGVEGCYCDDGAGDTVDYYGCDVVDGEVTGVCVVGVAVGVAFVAEIVGGGICACVDVVVGVDVGAVIGCDVGVAGVVVVAGGGVGGRVWDAAVDGVVVVGVAVYVDVYDVGDVVGSVGVSVACMCCC